MINAKYKTIQIAFIDIYKHKNNGKNNNISHDERLVNKNNINMEYLVFKSGNLVIIIYIDLQIKIILLWSHKTTQVKYGSFDHHVKQRMIYWDMIIFRM